MTEEKTTDVGLSETGYDLYDEELQKILESQEPTVVEGDDQAARALYHYRTLQKEIDRINALAAKRILDIQTWQLGIVGGLKKAQQYFRSPLEFYMRKVNQNIKKVKSIKFPEGMIGIRAQQPIIIIDEKVIPEVVARAGAPNEAKLVISKYSWDNKAIRTAAITNGEDLSWLIEIKDQDPKFYIKLREEGDERKTEKTD